MNVPQMLRSTPLAEVAISSDMIEQAMIIELPCSIVTSNLADTNEPFDRHMQDFVYAPRTAKVDAISLIGLPPGTTVFGGGHFLTAVNDKFIAEQYPPYIGTFVSTLAEITDASRPVIEVSGEKLLVGRFGITTWGHWLGELLPKVILAERSFPGRFTYVLPVQAVDRLRPNSIWSSIAESLEACGMGSDRLFTTDDNFNYSFKTLFALTSLWSDHIMHPRASESLRQSVSAIPPSSHKMLAVLRDPQFGRTLVNADEVYTLLQSHGFVLQTTGQLSFAEQVGAFKGANAVFGVLGSDLTNLLFSPVGIDVVTVGPDIFGDRFFYALVLDRGGRMADLRGPVVDPQAVMHRSTFAIDIQALAAALRTMAL